MDTSDAFKNRLHKLTATTYCCPTWYAMCSTHPATSVKEIYSAAFFFIFIFYPNLVKQ